MFGFDQLVDRPPGPERRRPARRGRGSRRRRSRSASARRDQQHDLAGPLVVAGAARAGQLGAEIDQVLAHAPATACGVGRLGAGAEDDRHAGSGPVGDRLGAGQQHDDPIFGRMLDRNTGEPVGEFAGDRVGRGDARLLRLAAAAAPRPARRRTAPHIAPRRRSAPPPASATGCAAAASASMRKSARTSHRHALIPFPC